ncbi:MAG: DUF4391 domain-containing protein [Clostridia bacterium]|nr:DUF4391 domain-containing protein [Clostridia bacterium]
MFDLSSKTKVDRKFRLTELYKMMSADKDVKTDGKSIISVVLTNVLSQDTMNLTATGKVQEIYIFDIELDTKTIPTLFISSLDKAINLHTVFILRYENEQMLYGCFKEQTEKGVKLGKYYGTDWTTDTTPIPLPLNVTCIDDIYTAIIDELIPITANVGEETSDFVARYDRINKLKKEIEKKQKQVDNERQSKRRFELNDELKALKKELALLNDKT